MSDFSNKTDVTTGGLSLTTILFLIFLVLKLTGYITWSWWWVTAPLWGGIVLLIAIAVFILLIFCIIGLIGIIKVLFEK